MFIKVLFYLHTTLFVVVVVVVFIIVVVAAGAGDGVVFVGALEFVVVGVVGVLSND